MPDETRSDTGEQIMIRMHIEKVRSKISRLDLPIDPTTNQKTDPTADQVFDPSAMAVFDYYGLNFDNARHFFGTFPSGRKKIAAHLFFPVSPQKPKAGVFLLHGYLDHAGILKNVIGHFLKKGYAIAVFDLPGHGFSSGQRGSIGDFKEYAQVFDDFINFCSPYLPKPWHCVAHSTGCAVVFEYLSIHQGTNNSPEFEKIVFMSPLVHSNHYYASATGHFLIKPFVNSISRKFRRSSSDPEFYKFLKKDPLQVRKIPFDWLEALFAWNRRIKKYNQLNQEILVIQGTRDKVVEWKYNLKFLKKKIPDIIICKIKKARHHLPNELPKFKDPAFEYMDRHIVEK